MDAGLLESMYITLPRALPEPVKAAFLPLAYRVIQGGRVIRSGRFRDGDVVESVGEYHARTGS